MSCILKSVNCGGKNERFEMSGGPQKYWSVLNSSRLVIDLGRDSKGIVFVSESVWSLAIETTVGLLNIEALETSFVVCCGKRCHAEQGSIVKFCSAVNFAGSSEANSGFATKSSSLARGICNQVKDLGSCPSRLCEDLGPSECIASSPRDNFRVEGGRRGTTKSTPSKTSDMTKDSKKGGSFETNEVADKAIP